MPKQKCITFKAPTTIDVSAHPTLSVESPNGVFGQISLGFNLTEDNSYTVYLHGDPQGATSQLTFRLDYEMDESNVHIYAYKKMANSIELKEGKYYGVDLTNANYVEKTLDKVEYKLRGDAPIDVEVFNIGIPLDADHKYVDITNHPELESTVEYYLYPAKDVLRDAAGKVQYFYWGEVVGHTLNEKNQVVMNGSEGAYPNSFKYGMADERYHYSVANQKNPAMNLYLDGQTLQRKWWENHLTWVKGMSFPNS